ncbi:MAG TPA: hypothetical protein DIW26_03195 [Ruminococcus sp.]|nr:hypothetical protein [Ruminococcus sp.]HCR73418.1 hypothetical protein [Ruminococcus sp.]
MKKITAIIAAMIFCTSSAFIPAYADETDDISQYIHSYDTLAKAPSLVFSENQMLMKFAPMVQVQGCMIIPDEIKWEISGTADTEYTSDSFCDILPHLKRWGLPLIMSSQFSFDSTNVLSISELTPCAPRFFRLSVLLTSHYANGYVMG